MTTAIIIGLVLLVVYLCFISYAPFIKAEFKDGVEIFKGLYSKEGFEQLGVLGKDATKDTVKALKSLFFFLLIIAAPITLPILLIIKVLVDGHAARQK